MMPPSLPVSILYCVIFLAIVLDVWLIFALEKRLRQQNIFNLMKDRARLLWGNFLSWYRANVLPAFITPESPQETQQTASAASLPPLSTGVGWHWVPRFLAWAKRQCRELLQSQALRAIFVEKTGFFSGFLSLVLIILLTGFAPLLVIKDLIFGRPLQLPFAEWL